MQLNDTTEPSTTAVVADTPAPEAAPAAVETKTEVADEGPSLDEDLSKAWRKANPPRENGKFVSPNPKPEAPVAAVDEKPVEAAPETEAKPEAEQAKTTVEAPRAWTAEAKAKWAALPPDVQQYVSSRENELHQTKSDMGRLAAEYKPTYEVLSQHKDYIQAVGKPVPQLLNDMLAASRALDTDPGGTIKALARMYGVDLGQLWDPSEQPPDPKVTALERENARLQSMHQQRAASEQAAREAQYNGLVEQFLTKNPDAKALTRDMAPLIQAIQLEKPTLEPTAVLQEAYERAAWANPATREARLKSQQEVAERARVEAAKKAAEAAKQAKGVRVAGAVASANGAGDLDSDLRSIWRKNVSR